MFQANKAGQLRRASGSPGEDDITHSADVSGESDTTEDNESEMQETDALLETAQSSSSASKATEGGEGRSEPQPGKVSSFFSLRCELAF